MREIWGTASQLELALCHRISIGKYSVTIAICQKPIQNAVLFMAKKVRISVNETKF